jgi:pyrroloquinoline-quinone synthase
VFRTAAKIRYPIPAAIRLTPIMNLKFLRLNNVGSCSDGGRRYPPRIIVACLVFLGKLGDEQAILPGPMRPLSTKNASSNSLNSGFDQEERIQMSATGLIQRLDSMVAERHLLTHPFYQAWSTGHLTHDSLRDYAAQYYRHVEAFPRYLSALHSRSEDIATRQALLENLIEEERGERNHPELWMRFAEGLGLSREEVRSSMPRRMTTDLIDTFMQLSRERSIAAGLTALYVYESQMPAVAETKIDGLKRFYGIECDDTVAFFTVHREADVDHARTGAELIEQFADTPEREAEVIAAANQAISALWSMLDGMLR